jgi:hypothetical protein
VNDPKQNIINSRLVRSLEELAANPAFSHGGDGFLLRMEQ